MDNKISFSLPTCKAYPGHVFEVDGKKYAVIRRLDPNTFDDRGNPTFYKVDYVELKGTTLPARTASDRLIASHDWMTDILRAVLARLDIEHEERATKNDQEPIFMLAAERADIRAAIVTSVDARNDYMSSK